MDAENETKQEMDQDKELKNQDQNTSSAETKKPDIGETPENMVPYERFKTVNERLRKLEEDREREAKEREKQEKKRLAEQEKFKELWEAEQAKVEELEPYRKRFEQVLESTKESNEKRISEIPENMRGLVPDYDDPIKLSNWLDANWEVFSEKTTLPNLDGGAGSGKRSSRDIVDKPSEQEIREYAAKIGVNPKYLADQYGVVLQG